MANYKQEIYLRYLEHTSISGQAPDIYSYEDWASATEYYINGWLPENKKAEVLDLGCGAGYFLKMLQGKGYTKLTGVDLSPGQVDLARKVCPTAKIVLGDCQNILLQSPGTYDLITGFDFIEHLSKDELLETLRLISKSLRPGGRLVFQTPNPDSPFGMGIRYGDFTHELALSPQGLHSLLRFAGATKYEARECGPYPHGFVSFVRYSAWNILRVFIIFWNLIETGNKGSGVYTRVFIAAGIKGDN